MRKVNAKAEMQKVIENIYYAMDKLPKMVEHKTFSMQLSTASEKDHY